jgi:general secretion pathway protein I
MRQRGFSLLEILVAFSILALSLGVMMQIFSDAARNAGLAHDQAQATELARTLVSVAAAELPQTTGERNGTENRFRWALRMEPYGADDAGQAAQPVSPATLELWQITARVTWPGPPERSVALTTLRTRLRSPQ